MKRPARVSRWVEKPVIGLWNALAIRFEPGCPSGSVLGGRFEPGLAHGTRGRGWSPPAYRAVLTAPRSRSTLPTCHMGEVTLTHRLDLRRALRGPAGLKHVHEHEREHRRMREHRRKRRRTRIQCDDVVGWRSAACVSLQAWVAASRLALPVAYVGISKRIGAASRADRERLYCTPWGGRSCSRPLAIVRGDR